MPRLCYRRKQPVFLNILRTCEKNGAAVVIIDTAPHAEQSALAAARAADIVIIPCRPSIVDLRAIGSTIDICRIADTPGFVVLNQTPARGSLADDAAEAIEELEVGVAPTQIGQRIAYIHAVTKGQGALECEPSGKAAEEIRTLYQFILNKAGTSHGKEQAKQARGGVARRT